ncbi:hybrid histidine kinase/response regulator HrmK [Calothrix sp. PCC 6303]|uniref:hybrid histidine kinase/response regulator HrmK n=1 Tax=Calothrix sp. PCC 6303 TaxID=1170562 RepID=UPI0002A0506F|nr:hybrid histidine kinase/response regulator HrmK [Calothrix sp. PCC 6303]AFZ04064.1 histidine kinase [Calothrix sp. PCC 6303]
MQQYSSLPEQNSPVDATTTTLTEIQRLRVELWLESSLNQLQSRLQKHLVSAFSVQGQLLGAIEADFFQMVVDELNSVLAKTQAAIALAHPQMDLCRIYHAFPSLDSLTLCWNLDDNDQQLQQNNQISYNNLEYLLQKSSQAFAIMSESGGTIAWLIVANLPQTTILAEQEIVPQTYISQLITRAAQQYASGLSQLYKFQTSQQLSQQLEYFNQELVHTNQLKNQFLANTSHEIRTPLSSILGFTHLLSVQGFEPERDRHQEYLTIIHSSGKHLLALINDILDLSKIEANQLEIQWETIEIPSLCRNIFALVKEKAASQGLQLRIELDENIDTIVADSLRLKQMLLNLLFNALKFTNKGTVGLKVRIDGQQVYFTVWDTGTGIPKEFQSELFKPYSQISNDLVSREEGTGLGLVVTRRLAELHHGWVEVESEIDQGSRFTIVLPLDRESASNLADTSSNKDTANQDNINNFSTHSPDFLNSGNSAQILLVEDDIPNGKLIQIYFQRFGYQVTWVKSIAQMWDALSQIHPAVLLLDVYLNNANALDVVQDLRQHPKYGSIPIIVQTAMAMKGDREICLASGVDDYVSKPIELPLLEKLVKKHLMLTQLEGEGSD